MALNVDLASHDVWKSVPANKEPNLLLIGLSILINSVPQLCALMFSR